MSNHGKYADARVEFSYPAGFHVQSSPEAGQYVIGKGKRARLLLSVLHKELMAGLFDRMARAPVLGPDRRKTVLDPHVIGDKHGRAIRWEVFAPDGAIALDGIEFFFDLGEWSALAKLQVHPTQSAAELEQVIASLRLTARQSGLP